MAVTIRVVSGDGGEYSEIVEEWYRAVVVDDGGRAGWSIFAEVMEENSDWVLRRGQFETHIKGSTKVVPCPHQPSPFPIITTETHSRITIQTNVSISQAFSSTSISLTERMWW